MGQVVKIGGCPTKSGKSGHLTQIPRGYPEHKHHLQPHSLVGVALRQAEGTQVSVAPSLVLQGHSPLC